PPLWPTASHRVTANRASRLHNKVPPCQPSTSGTGFAPPPCGASRRSSAGLSPPTRGRPCCELLRDLGTLRPAEPPTPWRIRTWAASGSCDRRFRPPPSPPYARWWRRRSAHRAIEASTRRSRRRDARWPRSSRLPASSRQARRRLSRRTSKPRRRCAGATPCAPPPRSCPRRRLPSALRASGSGTSLSPAGGWRRCWRTRRTAASRRSQRGGGTSLTLRSSETRPSTSGSASHRCRRAPPPAPPSEEGASGSAGCSASCPGGSRASEPSTSRSPSSTSCSTCSADAQSLRTWTRRRLPRTSSPPSRSARACTTRCGSGQRGSGCGRVTCTRSPGLRGGRRRTRSTRAPRTGSRSPSASRAKANFKTASSGWGRARG
ncbi:hypothetical protein EMIHUDRAFT_445840, partial [Emiliania huxleyi CCMP1516]|uniref:Uncharacterized protein n=2 Tax=Emiliania huxleyi TaxID=2903 RepID=A0A0D3IQA1_EMIH1